MTITEAEQTLLQNKYSEGLKKVKRISISTFLSSVIILFLPVQVWNWIIISKKRLLHLPEVTEPLFHHVAPVLILIAVVVITPIAAYYVFVYALRKDLQQKKKHCGLFKIASVKQLSERVAKNLDGLDTILYFEKNEAKVDRHLFSRAKAPDLLAAKCVYIEWSAHAKITLQQKIIDDSREGIFFAFVYHITELIWPYLSSCGFYADKVFHKKTDGITAKFIKENKTLTFVISLHHLDQADGIVVTLATPHNSKNLLSEVHKSTGKLPEAYNYHTAFMSEAFDRILRDIKLHFEKDL